MSLVLSCLKKRQTAVLLCLVLVGCNRTYPVAQPPKASPNDQSLRCLAAQTPMAEVQAGTEASGQMPSQDCLDRAKQIVAGLSLRQKLAQMMQPDRGRIRDLTELTREGYGSLLSGGGSAPNGNRAVDWSKMVGQFRQASLQSSAHIPLVYGVDAVHGHNNVYGAVIFPHNIGLGAARDADLVQRIGRATALEVRATQVDWTFAPVVAAARDERWGRTYEAFGETPELAELLGPALVRGLQGTDLSLPGSVLATAKHFVADGYTEGGVDQGNAPLNLQRVRQELLPAYQKVIAAGVGSIMVSYSSIDHVKMHCHGPLLNDALKRDLGFQGFLVSDWEAIEQLPGSYADQLTASINAGVDMVMAPKANAGFIDTMERLVPDAIPEARIDDAVTRILAIKCMLGMFDEDRYRPGRSGELEPTSDSVESFGSQQHRQLAAEAVRKSLVLLKNDNHALPLSATTKQLYITGTGADDVGRQCGGWTITWQGQSGDIPGGTSILQALKTRLGEATIVSYSKQYDARLAAEAPLALVVASERPYAEMKGDDPDLQLDPDDVASVAALRAAGKRVVLVLFSGRPLILSPVIDQVDAVVAAWLPGTEGNGVVDVLYGDQDFVGVLPHTWPRSIEQVPINVGDAVYDPLFAYGFGLHFTPQPTVD